MIQVSEHNNFKLNNLYLNFMIMFKYKTPTTDVKTKEYAFPGFDEKHKKKIRKIVQKLIWNFPKINFLENPPKLWNGTIFFF